MVAPSQVRRVESPSQFRNMKVHRQSILNTQKPLTKRMSNPVSREMVILLTSRVNSMRGYAWQADKRLQVA